jgi:endonuclease/exonuclease/phosphatase family metal-dependent hydrolase
MEKLKTVQRTGNYLYWFGIGVLRKDYLNLGETQIDSSLEVLTKPIQELLSSKEIIPQPLRMISWNIQRGYRWTEVVRVLNDLSPDVLMLQESPITRDGIVFSKEFAERNNYWSVFYPAILNHGHWQKDFSCFGQATLSKHPILDHEVIGLQNVYDWEAMSKGKASSTRNTLYTRIDINGRNLGVYNIHLDPFTSPKGRVEQMKPVIAHIERGNDDWMLIGGDFNTPLGKRELVVKKLRGVGFEYVGKNLRQQSRIKLPDLDYFLVRNIPSVDATSLVTVEGSDHKPVEARLFL